MKAVALSFFCLLLSGCVRHFNAPDESVLVPTHRWHVERDVTYTPADWPQTLHADLYQPEGPGPFPAVLIVHGGGWSGRTRDDMASISETLAESGFAVMNIEYRLAPEYQFPAQLHDLQQAMHWLNANAARFHIDTGKLAGYGYSSGAHLISLLALVAAEGGKLDSPYGGPETRLDAVVSGGTPSDLRKFRSGKLVEQFLGGTADEVPDLYAAASPVTHITADAPPFFLYHGTMDDLVPVDHATDFQADLAQYGVPTEMMLLRYRGHIATFLTSQSAVEASIQFLYRTLSLGDDGDALPIVGAH